MLFLGKCRVVINFKGSDISGTCDTRVMQLTLMP